MKVSGQPVLVRALVKFFYTDSIDKTVEDTAFRQFIGLAEQLCPEHRPKLLELLLLTKAIVPSRMGQDMDALFGKKLLSDVSLVVEGRVLPAHKAILIARSPYFSALFLGGLKESRSNEILLADISFHSLELIVRYLYTKDVSPILAAASDDEEGVLVPEMFSLACQYGVRHLKRDLENILTYNVAVENASSLLVLAERFNAAFLRAKCQALFSAQRALIEKTDDYAANRSDLEHLFATAQ